MAISGDQTRKNVDDLIKKSSSIFGNSFTNNSPLLHFNPALPGQGTLIPSLGTKVGESTKWAFLNQTPKIQSHVIVIPLALPGMLSVFEEAYRATLRQGYYHLLTTACRSITGLNATRTGKFDETAIHNSQEKFFTPIGIMTEASAITREIKDVGNGTYQALLEHWLYMAFPGEYNRQSGVVREYEIRQLPFDPGFDKRPDIIGASCAYIELESTQRHVIRCWITYNEIPETSGTVEGKRVLGEDLTPVELSIPFKHFTIVDDATRALGQKIWDEMRGAKSNVYNPLLTSTTPGFTELEPIMRSPLLKTGDVLKNNGNI